jgi:hypothetical protein
MRRSKITFLLAGLAAAALGVDTATAGRRSFTVDPMGVRAANGAGKSLDTGGLAGVSLPDNGTPDFGFGFVIPRGYRRNAPIRILLNWQTADTSCGIVLQPEFVDRSRPGHAPTTGPPADDLAAEDLSLVLAAPATSLQGNLKVFILSRVPGFDQQSGDAIHVAFVRDAGALSDTCSDDLVVSGITVEYPTP